MIGFATNQLDNLFFDFKGQNTHNSLFYMHICNTIVCKYACKINKSVQASLFKGTTNSDKTISHLFTANVFLSA